MTAKKNETFNWPAITMTEKQLRMARKLIKAECANYSDGQCMVLDYTGDGTVCAQWISYSMQCKYFRENILPLDPELQMNLDRPKNVRRCSRCGKDYIPGSNRAMYCPECSKAVRKERERERIRKLREHEEEKQK